MINDFFLIIDNKLNCIGIFFDVRIFNNMPRWLFGLFKAFNHLCLKIRTILDKRTVCMIFMSCSNNAVKPFFKSSYVWWHDNTFIPFKMSLQTMQFWVERDVFPRLACYINIKIVRASWNIKKEKSFILGPRTMGKSFKCTRDFLV